MTEAKWSPGAIAAIEEHDLRRLVAGRDVPIERDAKTGELVPVFDTDDLVAVWHGGRWRLARVIQRTDSPDSRRAKYVMASVLAEPWNKLQPDMVTNFTENPPDGGASVRFPTRENVEEFRAGQSEWALRPV